MSEITFTMFATYEERLGGGCQLFNGIGTSQGIWMSRVTYIPRYQDSGVSDFLSPGGRCCFEQGALPRKLP